MAVPKEWFVTGRTLGNEVTPVGKIALAGYAAALFAAGTSEAAVRTMISHVVPGPAGAPSPVEILILNEGDSPTRFAVPASIAASLKWSDRSIAVTIERTADAPPQIDLPAHGFARIAYSTRLPAGVSGDAVLSVPASSSDGLAFTATQSTERVASAPAARVAPVSEDPVYTVRYRSADGDRGNAFLPNLTAYQPVYAVYGPGTDSDARLQISFKYQLLGDARDGQQNWSDGLHFAFTQRLYWNLGQESSPFRNVDYLPELFYLLPQRRVSSTVSLGGQTGFRHESNGRGGVDSRSFNTLYVQPFVSMPIGSAKLTLGPRLWLYVGSREDNPDIRRYRGNASLFAEIGRDDGWRLTTEGRLNPSTGKGALDALASYPLDVAIARRLKLYVFAQGFVGYGENLLDYDRHATRLRAGIGIVR